MDNTEFKGTKGFWTIQGINYFTVESVPKKGEVMSSSIIATVNPCSSIEQSRANAQLMAISPELLSEHQMDLKHLLTWEDQILNAGLKGSTMYQEYLDMVDAKKKVIEKALKQPEK